MLTGRRTELRAQLQPDYRHHEAHEPEQGHRQHNRIAHRPERQSDREVVQAQRGPADQQPPPVPDLRRVVTAAQRLDESPDRGHEQNPGACPAGGGPQWASETGADEHPSGRHHDIAKPKTVATVTSVRRSTPATPMAIAAPKLFSPSATATH